MVNEIKNVKDDLLERMRQSINERGVDRADVKELGDLADAVKDLAEAEKACWEAEYYMNVSEAMEKSGYTPDGVGRGDYRMDRQGYRDSRGRYSRRGYSSMGYHDEMDGVREAMRNATPEEREKMQREMRQMLNM